MHHPPLPEDHAEAQTERCSTEADSLRTESDDGIAETESAAGSSGLSDPTSDCSNSDVEIYLEGHTLDSSAMRLNCVMHNSFNGG